VRLELGGQRSVEIQTREELERALAELGAGALDFAILQDARGDGPPFAQAAGTPETGFVVEVHEADAVHESGGALTRADVVELLASWLARDDRWRTAIAWETVARPKPNRPPSYRLALALLATAAIVALGGSWLEQRVEARIAAYARAEGKVVAAERHQGSKNRTSYHTTVRFTADGAVHQVTDWVKARPRVGERLDVRYDPRDPPGTAYLTAPIQGKPSLLVAAFLAAWAIGSGVKTAFRRRRAAAPGVSRIRHSASPSG
jgi:hypothetical protein